MTTSLYLTWPGQTNLTSVCGRGVGVEAVMRAEGAGVWHRFRLTTDGPSAAFVYNVAFCFPPRHAHQHHST